MEGVAASDKLRGMIWFFERDDRRLHYEIRHCSDGHDYELAITYPDGTQDVERFRDSAQVTERSLELQKRLIAEGWRPPAPAERQPRR